MEVGTIRETIEGPSPEKKPSVPAENLTPPASEDMEKAPAASSDLSDAEVDDDDDIGEIEPDHYWEGGKVPVFKPVGLFIRISMSPLCNQSAERVMSPECLRRG